MTRYPTDIHLSLDSTTQQTTPLPLRLELTLLQFDSTENVAVSGDIDKEYAVAGVVVRTKLKWICRSYYF